MESINTGTSKLALRTKFGTSQNSTFDPSKPIAAKDLIRPTKKNENKPGSFCIKNGVGDYVHEQSKRFERIKNPKQKQSLQQELVKNFTAILDELNKLPDEMKQQLSSADKKMIGQIQTNLNRIKNEPLDTSKQPLQSITQNSEASGEGQVNNPSLNEPLIGTDPADIKIDIPNAQASPSPSSTPSAQSSIVHQDPAEFAMIKHQIQTVGSQGDVPFAQVATQTDMPPLTCEPSEFAEKFGESIQDVIQHIELAKSIQDPELQALYEARKDAILNQANMMVKLHAKDMGKTATSMIKNVIDTHAPGLTQGKNPTLDPQLIKNKTTAMNQMLSYDKLRNGGSVSSSVAQEAIKSLNELETMNGVMKASNAFPADVLSSIQSSIDSLKSALKEAGVNIPANPRLDSEAVYGQRHVIAKEGNNVVLANGFKETYQDLAELSKTNNPVLEKAFRSLSLAASLVGVNGGSHLNDADFNTLKDIGAIQFKARADGTYDPLDLLDPESGKLNMQGIKKQSDSLRNAILNFAMHGNTRAANEKMVELAELCHASRLALEFSGGSKKESLDLNADFQKNNKRLQNALSPKSAIGKALKANGKTGDLRVQLNAAMQPVNSKTIGSRLSDLDTLAKMAQTTSDVEKAKKFEEQADAIQSRANSPIDNKNAIASTYNAFVDAYNANDTAKMADAYVELATLASKTSYEIAHGSNPNTQVREAFDMVLTACKQVSDAIEGLADSIKNAVQQRIDTLTAQGKNTPLNPVRQIDHIVPVIEAPAVGNISKKIIMNGTPYSVVKTLGQGAFGTTYLVTHPNGKQLALKVEKKVNGRGNPVSYQKAHIELDMQAKVASKQVINVYAMGESKTSTYSLMELAEGQEGVDLINTKYEGTDKGDEYDAYLDENITSIVEQMADLSNDLETAGVEHHDIKLENMSFGKNGQLKLYDFGLSVDYGRTPSLKGTMIYQSANYFDMTPKERDEYALGCTAIYAIATRFNVDIGSVYDITPKPGETVVDTIRRANRQQQNILKNVLKKVKKLDDPKLKQRYMSALQQINQWMGSPLKLEAPTTVSKPMASA